MWHDIGGRRDRKCDQEREIGQLKNDNRNCLHGYKLQRQGLRCRSQAQDNIDEQFELNNQI